MTVCGRAASGCWSQHAEGVPTRSNGLEVGLVRRLRYAACKRFGRECEGKFIDVGVAGIHLLSNTFQFRE